MHWTLLTQDKKLQDELSGALNILPITAQVMINRGIKTPADGERFLNPSLRALHDPFLMADMEKGVRRIVDAILGRERITIYGDYDADGVTSTALLLNFFKAVDTEAAFYIPHRVNEGYGLNNDAIAELQRRGTQLIITVDCGINALDQVLNAKKLGMDMVITDHHEPSAELPAACATINPKRSDCKFPFKQLAGVGIVFNLIMALRQRLRELGYFKTYPEPRLRDMLDIVAIGTIADVVPLIDENRIFVKFGLEELKISSNKGINALKIISGLEAHEINTTAVAFRLAPRINAAGRVDDQNLGVRLLVTDDPEEAVIIAQKLHGANSRRQAIEGAILKDAGDIIKNAPEFEGNLGLTIYKEGWHPGVIGIVATRLAEEHKKPTVIIGISEGLGRGSVRSVGEYNVIDVLRRCEDLLIRFGGHRHAAGLSIEPQNIEKFKKKFNDIISATLGEEDRVSRVFIDAELLPADVTEGLINELELMEPFGKENPEPVFSMKEMKVSHARVVAEKHLKLKFTDNMVILDAIGFGMGSSPVTREDVLDVAFIPQRDTWAGKGAVQLKLRDIKAV